MNNEKSSKKTGNSEKIARVAEGFVMPEPLFNPEMKGFVIQKQYPTQRSADDTPLSAEEWYKQQVKIADEYEAMIKARFGVSRDERDKTKLSEDKQKGAE
jgi:hypothetical protein